MKLPDAERRRAWLAHSPTRAVWISACPNKNAWTIDGWAEITSYFGLPSPACQTMVRERIGAQGRRAPPQLDAHGVVVCPVALTTDGWSRLQHDPVLNKIVDVAHHTGSAADKEVVGLFLSVVSITGPGGHSTQITHRCQIIAWSFARRANQCATAWACTQR